MESENNLWTNSCPLACAKAEGVRETELQAAGYFSLAPSPLLCLSLTLCQWIAVFLGKVSYHLFKIPFSFFKKWDGLPLQISG